MNNYEDIINLPHHISESRTPMSLYNRSAQFAPFSALVGYDKMINNAGIILDNKISLSEDYLLLLDNKINEINKIINLKPVVTIKYFIPSNNTNKGKYITITNNIKKIDTIYREIILEDNKKIYIDNIIDIKLV